MKWRKIRKRRRKEKNEEVRLDALAKFIVVTTKSHEAPSHASKEILVMMDGCQSLRL